MKSSVSRSARMGVIALSGLGLWMLAGTASAACLQRVEATIGKVSTYSFMIAPERAVAGYVSSGFSRIDCPSDMSVMRNYVAILCSANSSNKMPSLNGVVVIAGITGAQSCQDAKAGLAEATGTRN
jgi:hypothetical protein